MHTKQTITLFFLNPEIEEMTNSSIQDAFSHKKWMQL